MVVIVSGVTPADDDQPVKTTELIMWSGGEYSVSAEMFACKWMQSFPKGAVA